MLYSVNVIVVRFYLPILLSCDITYQQWCALIIIINVFVLCDVGSKHVLLPINSTVSCAVTDQQYYVMCCYRSTVLCHVLLPINSTASCAVTDQQYCVVCCYRSTVLRHVLLPINSVASCAVTNQQCCVMRRYQSICSIPINSSVLRDLCWGKKHTKIIN